ncbi:MAG: hypothetical protein A2655_04585 [Candidatus Yanofskybacteria bacterium RIFCSPHIGHO2_01_FULL_43_42]|uniref:Uncharacterized protein n=1 Tax=Candidatus Taylorbacteria bacterium RIFCSPLOWO2_01_FULL_45_15b TaxID=1802319 RepID=A0A1G2N8Z5_9BACT|nr:MAG: hypothetical protein A2655_04585 [Candidatus Yanofskybacteria bacterium RIFCSPHIGHO2_01_FULL_43_42]OHA32608.1 MAG: hypothetical protein A2928_02770 [Candidatus Taylorbacteria bacterium RIFCSPLOWO2_01_FULL_45_15b]
MKTPFWIGLGIILILIVGASVFLPIFNPKDMPSSKAEIMSFEVKKHRFEIQGKNLEHVEVWGVPRGDEIGESDYTKFGGATLEGDLWVLAIPDEPMQISDVIAVGIKGDVRVSKSLSASVATSVGELLWPEKSSVAIDLTVGKTATSGDISVTILGLKEESRCAEGVTCIWAGRVSFLATVESGIEAENITLASDTPSFAFGKRFEVASVTPYPKQNIEIKESDYRIRLIISSNE